MLPRLLLTVFIVSIFAVTVVSVLMCELFCSEERRRSFRRLLNILLPAETALLGAVVAYYFVGPSN